MNSLPSDVRAVAVYISSLAKEGKAVSTVVSHLAAIKYFHDQARLTLNWQDPILSEVMAGIRRSSTRKVEKATAILPEHLKALLTTLGGSLSDCRDRALLLVGFSGAFRRSELTSITVETVAFVPEGAVVTVLRSKTDQTSQGAEVSIPFARDPEMCAVKALYQWLSRSRITTGPVFRRVYTSGNIGNDALSEEAVRLILAKAVESANLSGNISPHSLRAGFCTAAALKGASLEQIGRHARHASTQTTLGYVRVAERFKNHAGAELL